MKNFDWCVYTYNHRKMFAYIADKLIKDEKDKRIILERARWHDVDKLLMYAFLDQDISQKHHVIVRNHHLECKNEKTYMDYLETVIDYECSPYTKPDKPLNAFDFLNKLKDMKLVSDKDAEILFSIMHQLGIDRSYNVQTDAEGAGGMEYVRSLPKVTEEMILKEIVTYVDSNKDNEIPWILEQLEKKY